MKRIAGALLLVLAACGGDDGEPATDTTSTTSVAPNAVTTTTMRFSTADVSTPEASEQGVLTDVAVGQHDGFVRVVFTFSNVVPGYSVEKAEPPFTQDGSGDEVTVDGVAHLAVRLTARAHDDEGSPTVSRKPIEGPAGSTLEEVVLLGDFEGVVNYVIGLTDAKPFKVFTLRGPHRLVIDVEED